MKKGYYIFCLIPAALLAIAFLLPNSGSGGSIFSLSMGLIAAIAILCPLIALIGLVLFCLAMIYQKPKRPILVATAIGVLPGILLYSIIHIQNFGFSN